MANLLPRAESRTTFPKLDLLQRDRLDKRLQTLVAVLRDSEQPGRLERRLRSFEASLEELESDVSFGNAQDLLNEFDHTRCAALRGTERGDGVSDTSPDSTASTRLVPTGGLICYWPGRSLSTGEAEIASRGFFDVLDRPPFVYWLEAIARRVGKSSELFEVAILAWIPASDFARAEAGRRACPNGALAMLTEVSTDLAQQLESSFR